MSYIQEQLDTIINLLNSNDVSNKIVLASLFVALGALIVTIIVNIVTNHHYVESKAPQLTFSLSETNSEIFLTIKNTGATTAQGIKIVINSIANNGDRNEVFNPFGSEFDLYPEEIVQGVVSYSGENICTQIFPIISVNVTYKAMNTKKKVRYSRNITFTKKPERDTEKDKVLKGIEDKLDSIMYSQNRVANYIEGRTLFPIDRLNVMAHGSLKEDMMEVIKLNNSIQISNQVLSTIKQRSSVRAYNTEQLTQSELDIILKAGLMAPTGMNRQEIHFTVVKGDNPVLAELDEEKRQLRGQEKQPHNFYYEAPVLIFLSAEDEFKWNKVDSGIAVENMALAAESLGLGTLIIGCVYDALHGEKQGYFSEKLQIPQGYSFQIAIAVGHKMDNKTPHEYDYEKQVTIIE